MIVFNEQCIYQVFIDERDRQRLTTVVEDDEDVLESMWTWCEETFGFEDDIWYHMYTECDDFDTFAFKYEEHRNWFLLKWG